VSVSATIEVRNYILEQVEEELYSDTDTIPANTRSPLKVCDGKIRDGYDAVAISVACTQNSDVYLYLKIAGKQVYPNGLNTAGLAGLSEETLLLVKIPEGNSWEIGFANIGASDASVSWRFRLRLFRKR
jgi:hypothetical protein